VRAGHRLQSGAGWCPGNRAGACGETTGVGDCGMCGPLMLAGRGGMSVLLVEQHVGFALRAAQQYYVLEADRVVNCALFRDQTYKSVSVNIIL
jgi:hypothetical protein